MSNLPSPQRAAAQLRKLSPRRPRLGIVLGSGFQAVARRVQLSAECEYRKLPGFLPTQVEGHEGRVLIGTLGQAEVIVLSGRTHYYEGHSLAQITFPIRVLAAFGIETVLLTNAAGAINRRFRPGDFMAFTDHINFMGESPLRGLRANGSRFVDLSQAYDSALRRDLARAAKRARVALRTGVYAALSGPNYETPAEIRALRTLGADAVGMSTVPEVIVARQCGLRVAAISCLTNMAAGISSKLISHEEVLEQGRRSATAASDLLEQFVT